ncbi:MAG: thioesterase family protein [Candidatus Nanopelagicales bacterium]
MNRYPIATRWNDNDHYGHVNNATYFEYLDTAVNGWLMQSTGLDIRELPAVGIVASVSCEFYREIGFPDVLEVELFTERIGTSSVTYQLDVFRSGDAEVRARGRFVHVYVDATTRRPVPIPAVVGAALAALPERLQT